MGALAGLSGGQQARADSPDHPVNPIRKMKDIEEELFTTSGLIEPIEAAQVESMLEQAIAWLDKSGKKHEFNYPHSRLQYFYDLRLTNDCSLKTLSRKSSDVEAFSKKYPKISAYLEQIWIHQLETCGKRLVEEIHTTIASDQKDCSRPDHVGRSCTDKFDELKEEIKSHLRESTSRVVDYITDEVDKIILGKAIGSYMSNKGVDMNRHSEESWTIYKERLTIDMDRQITDKCKANKILLGKVVEQIEELSQLQGLDEDRLGQETWDWMETINLCESLIKYEPFNLFMVQLVDFQGTWDRLFNKYVTKKEKMDLKSIRENLELVVIMVPIRRHVFNIPGPNLKHYQKLLDTTRCDLECDRYCFRRSEDLARQYQYYPHIYRLFTDDYKRQMDVCVEKTSQQFKNGLRQLLQLPQKDIQMVVINRMRDALIRSIQENEINPNQSPYSIEVVNNFFPNGLALYWREKRHRTNFLKNTLETQKSFEDEFRKATMNDCKLLDKLEMLNWNDDFVLLDKDEIDREFGPDSSKWIIHSNLCRVILYGDLGVRGAWISVTEKI